MHFKFNDYNLIEKPKIMLCKIELERLGFLNANNIVIKPTFCSLSELTFTIYAGSNHYDSVRKDMVLEVEGFGRFVISDFDEQDDGQTKYKDVTANSYEITMNKFTLTYPDNTYFWLYNPTDKKYPSLLSVVTEQCGWDIDYVDPNVSNELRCMSIDGEQAYGLLMGDIAEAFKCFFVFDTLEKKVSCYGRDVVPKNLGVNLSVRNLIQEVNIKESTEDIITALTVIGSEGVGINTVNPLGNNVIYDFSYYCNDEPWGMPKDLQDAVKAWQDKIDSYRKMTADTVQRIRESNEELLNLQSELKILDGELKALEDIQAVDIAAERNDALPGDKEDIDKKQAEIDAKKLEISTVEASIELDTTRRSAIATALSFEENFTPEQYEVLQYYINSSVYENTNFVNTSIQTEAQKIDVSNALYKQGLLMMDTLHKPLYEYECKVVPFMFNLKYSDFAEALELGGFCNLEIDADRSKWVQGKFIQAVIDYDNSDNTTIILSDSFRLMDDVYTFADGYSQTVKASRKSAASASKWDDPYNNGFFDSMQSWIDNALDLTKQEIINANNQEFTLGSYGLRGRMLNPDTGNYDDCQLAMTNNVLAFTRDGWNSCATALGKIDFKGTEYYGLVAEALIGNIIAGQQLTIMSGEEGTESEKSFIMNAGGTTLKNATFTITNGNTQILLSPSDGFKIQKKNGSAWTDVLSEDTYGNIIANNITVNSGKIGGWTITSESLTSPTGDYIASNGTGKLSLLTWNNSEANFDGNIYAHNLHWRYGETDYGSLFNWSDALGGIVLVDGFGNDMPLYSQAEVRYGNDANNLARIYSRRDFIDQQAPDQESIYIESLVGNVHLNCLGEKGNVIVNGGFVTDTLVAGKSTFNGDVTFNSGLLFDGNVEFGKEAKFDSIVFKKDVTVDKNFKAAQLESNNYVICSNFKSNNAYNAVGFECTAQFNGDIKTAKNGNTHLGSTKTMTIDGVTLQFVNGLLVN